MTAAVGKAHTAAEMVRSRGNTWETDTRKKQRCFGVPLQAEPEVSDGSVRYLPSCHSARACV